MRQVRGFTLIELIVVLLIVVVLVGFAFPAYMEYVARSKSKVASADLMTLSTQVESFRQRTLAYPAQAGIEQFDRFNPASTPEEFSFSYAPTDEGYEVQARWLKKGQLDGCVISINQRGERRASDCLLPGSW